MPVEISLNDAINTEEVLDLYKRRATGFVPASADWKASMC
jgi:hypothetical protein